MTPNITHINIFVAMAPVQLLAISSILNRMSVEHHVANICFVFYKSDISFRLPNCEMFVFNTRKLGAFFHAMIRFRKEMRKILASEKKLTVYIPHPYHLPTNYLLFGIKEKKAYLIPDGILNYYDSKITMKQLATMMAKFLLALMLGMSYTPYTGHLTAYDKRAYSGVHTFDPDGLVTDCGQIRVIKTDVERFGREESGKTCLVLDQDIESLVNREDSRKMRMVLHQYLASEQFDTIWYKPHPSSNNRMMPPDMPITIIDSALPAEMLISRYRPTEVVSFVSSALINIRDMNPDIRCTSLGFEKILSVNNRIKPLFDLFSKKGINIIKV